MTNLRKKAARIVCCGDGGCQKPMGGCQAHHYQVDADAVIAAVFDDLAEPGEEMLDAAEAAPVDGYEFRLAGKVMWKRMHAVALKEIFT